MGIGLAIYKLRFDADMVLVALYGTFEVIPPKANSAFVAAMEDVLAVYTRPRDRDCPLVCLDETSKQLVAETRVPMPMKAGTPSAF